MARALLRAARLGSSWVPERPAPSQAARRPALEALPQEDEATSELAAVPDRGAFRLFRKPCAPRPRRLPVVTAVSRRPAVPVRGRFWVSTGPFPFFVGQYFTRSASTRFASLSMKLDQRRVPVRDGLPRVEVPDLQRRLQRCRVLP